MNQDGFDDVIIGAPDFNDNYGVVYVVYGASSFVSSTFNLR